MSACLLCGDAAAHPLFHATDRLYRTTSKRFAVVRCDACGLVRLDPQPPPEELRGYYPGDYWFSPGENAASRLEEAYRRAVLRDHVAFVEQALRDTDRSGPLLDAGCGGGLFLGMMRARGHRVVGLDFSPAAAGIAWQRQQVPAVCGVVTDAPFAAGSFTAISLFHVVEHLADPRAHLEAARRLLRPGGRLIVQVPDAACWQFRLLGSAWNGLDVPRHLYDFRASDLERLLDSCGFSVLRRKHFSLRDNPAGLASSVAPSLDPMARRIRGTPEGPTGKIARDLLYLAILAAALPFTVVEAAFGAGSTIMVEAGRKA